jgi:hypothetical protein
MKFSAENPLHLKAQAHYPTEFRPDFFIGSNLTVIFCPAAFQTDGTEFPI